MLVRRVRDRLCQGRRPVCIGTSATMSSEAEETRRAAAVADVATRLFGTSIPQDAIIEESLWRATNPALTPESLGNALAAAVDAEIPTTLSDDERGHHTLVMWIEPEVGVDDHIVQGP